MNHIKEKVGSNFVSTFHVACFRFGEKIQCNFSIFLLLPLYINIAWKNKFVSSQTGPSSSSLLFQRTIYLYFFRRVVPPLRILFSGFFYLFFFFTLIYIVIPLLYDLRITLFISCPYIFIHPFINKVIYISPIFHCLVVLHILLLCLSLYFTRWLKQKQKTKTGLLYYCILFPFTVPPRILIEFVSPKLYINIFPLIWASQIFLAGAIDFWFYFLNVPVI